MEHIQKSIEGLLIGLEAVNNEVHVRGSMNQNQMASHGFDRAYSAIAQSRAHLRDALFELNRLSSEPDAEQFCFQTLTALEAMMGQDFFLVLSQWLMQQPPVQDNRGLDCYWQLFSLPQEAEESTFTSKFRSQAAQRAIERQWTADNRKLARQNGWDLTFVDDLGGRFYLHVFDIAERFESDEAVWCHVWEAAEQDVNPAYQDLCQHALGLLERYSHDEYVVIARYIETAKEQLLQEQAELSELGIVHRDNDPMYVQDCSDRD